MAKKPNPPAHREPVQCPPASKLTQLEQSDMRLLRIPTRTEAGANSLSPLLALPLPVRPPSPQLPRAVAGHVPDTALLHRFKPSTAQFAG